eukprot:5630714-Prymnesium_polylepis.2
MHKNQGQPQTDSLRPAAGRAAALEGRSRLLERRDAAVERETEVRIVRNEPQHPVVAQRWHRAVLVCVEAEDGLRTQGRTAAQPGAAATPSRKLAARARRLLIRVALVHPEPALDRHRDARAARRLHDCLAARRDRLRLEHEAGAIVVSRLASRLRRAAAVQ